MQWEKKKKDLFMQHSLQRCWCLGFIRTDDEQRKEDREQATTKTNHRNHIKKWVFCKKKKNNRFFVMLSQTQFCTSFSFFTISVLVYYFRKSPKAIVIKNVNKRKEIYLRNNPSKGCILMKPSKHYLMMYDEGRAVSRAMGKPKPK